MNPGSDSVSTDFQGLQPQCVQELATALENAFKTGKTSVSKHARSDPSSLQDSLEALNQVRARSGRRRAAWRK